jgi:hypothetical protein
LVVVSLAVVAVKIGRAKGKKRTASFFSFVLLRNWRRGYGVDLILGVPCSHAPLSCVEIPLLF